MKIGLIVNPDKARAFDTAQRIVELFADTGVQLLSSRGAPVPQTVVLDSSDEVIRACDAAVTRHHHPQRQGGRSL